MLDKTNPTNQFHSYQRADATPHSEEPSSSGLKDVLGKVGINTDNLGGLSDTLKNFDVRQSMDKVRGMARSNPAMVLGGLAAAAIGVGLLGKMMSRGGPGRSTRRPEL